MTLDSNPDAGEPEIRPDRSCPRCGLACPGSARAQVCPRCVLKGALENLELRHLPLSLDEPDSVVPSSLGGYELLERIAAGGMGVVFKARQKRLDRVVALKILPYGTFARESFRQRFRREASAAGKLQHPNIVAVHEIGEEFGQPYYSMDFVDGPSLLQLIRSESIAAGRAARFVETIAEAIQYAHEMGILHRDLKPANVLVDPLDQPRITDFGLAKDLAGDASLTQSSHVFGSPSYMPPEQALGSRAFERVRGSRSRSDSETAVASDSPVASENDAAVPGSRHEEGTIGPASDVYGIGAIFYHLLTGRPPFHGETLHDVLEQLANKEPVPVRLLNPAVPRDLQTICMKCLEKVPSRRYATAQAVADELARWRQDKPILARPVTPLERGWRWCRRNPALATLALVAFLVPLVLISGSSAAALIIHRARATAENLLQRNRIQVAEGHFLRDEPGLAIVELTRVLREQPTNAIAAQRLLSALTHRRFPVPLAPALRHSDQIRKAVFSPDSSRIATASADGTARLWNANTGDPLGTPMVHGGRNPQRTSNALWSVAFSPDGGLLATASADGSARIWNGHDGSPASPPLDHGPAIESTRSWHVGVSSVTFTRQGRQLLSTGDDGCARVWNVTDGAVHRTFPHPGLVWAAALTPDETLLATACWDGNAYLWNFDTGQRVAILPHASRVWSVEFSPDGDRLLSGERTWYARMWKRNGDWWERQFELLPGGEVARVKFFGDGRSVVTTSTLRFAQIWGSNSGREFHRLHQKARALDLDLSPDSAFLAVASECASANVYSRAGERIMEPLRHGSTIRTVRFSPDGSRIVTAGDSGEAWIWRFSSSPRVEKFFHGDGGWSSYTGGWLPLHLMWFAAPSKDGQYLLTASLDGTGRIWQRHTGRLLHVLPHGGRLHAAKFSLDCTRAITCGADGSARIWNVATGSQIGPSLVHERGVRDVDFSPDGSRVVTGGEDHRAYVWSIPNPVRPLTMQHGDDIRTVRFGPDGKRILTASDDHTAQIWDAETGQKIGQPFPHANEVMWAEFSPDGTKVATASRDHTARLWDATTQQAIGSPIRHESLVSRARFDPTGKYLLTISEDRTIRVTDVASGQERFPPILHGQNVEDAAFGPDGRWIVSASLDNNSVRAWDATTGQALGEPVRMIPFGTVPTQDGRQILLYGEDGIARLMDAPLVPPPVPRWFLALAEALGGFREKGDSLEPVPTEELHALKVAHQSKQNSDDFYDRWATWFFSDPAQRTLTPLSRVTFADCVRRMEESGTYPALREASQLVPNNPRILAKLAIAEYEAKIDLKPEARFHLRLARSIAPDDPEVRRAVRLVLPE